MVTEKPPMLSGDEGFAGLFTHYAILEYGWQLRVRINVLAKPIGEGQTEVRVHALYTFGDFLFETGGVAAKNLWTRVSGGGLDSREVTCKLTHVAEKRVLEWARSAEAVPVNGAFANSLSRRY